MERKLRDREEGRDIRQEGQSLGFPWDGNRSPVAEDLPVSTAIAKPSVLRRTPR